jgi:outer membrane protein
MLCMLPAVSGAGETMSLDAAYRLALENNHDIRIAEESVVQGELLKKQAITVLFPDITAVAGYSRITYDGGTETDGTSWGLSLNQTLWNGGRVWVAKRGAQYTLTAAEHGLEFARQSILMELIARSFDVLSAEDLLAVSEKRVLRVQEQLRLAEARLELGEAPKTIVLAGKVALSSAELEKLESQKTLSLARTRLADLVGLESEVRVEMPVAVKVPARSSVSGLKETAAAQRADLAQSREMVRIAGEEAELVSRADGINVDLTASYNQYSEENPFAPETQVGITATWPFFQGGLVGLQTREAYSRVRQTEEGYGRQLDGAMLQVEEALLTLETLQTQRTLVKTNLEVASENHRLAKTSFELGAAVSLDVLDAEEDLAEAENLAVSHMYDMKKARAALLYAIGALDIDDLEFENGTGRPE